MFDEEMGDITYDTSSGKIGFDVTVTNTGSVAGKDAVEVYYNPPYTNGVMGSASANLVSFEKTKELNPGESETISIEFDDDDMASYDYWNAKSYVLESGDYRISVRSDSHNVIDEKTVNVASTTTTSSGINCLTSSPLTTWTISSPTPVIRTRPSSRLAKCDCPTWMVRLR